MIDVAQPHLKDVTAPSARGLPSRGGKPKRQEHGPDLTREACMRGRNARHPVQDCPVRFEETSEKCRIYYRVVGLKNRRGDPRNPALPLVAVLRQPLSEPSGLPPPGDPDGSQ